MIRSNLPNVRNPLLGLPAANGIAALPADSKLAVRNLFIDIRAQAKEKSDNAYQKNKAWMYVYWKLVSIYAYHVGRLFR